jgi:hypothetical protein
MADDPFDVPEQNAEKIFSGLSELHLGQHKPSFPSPIFCRTSNLSLQFLHSYSYIGMITNPPFLKTKILIYYSIFSNKEKGKRIMVMMDEGRPLRSPDGRNSS